MKKSGLSILLAVGKTKKKPDDGAGEAAMDRHEDMATTPDAEGTGAQHPDGEEDKAPDEEMPESEVEPDAEGGESEGMEEKGENCIPLPKGLKAPANAKDGSFQGVFRGRIEGGKLYFDSINNIPTHTEEGETAEEEAEEPLNEELNEQRMGVEMKPEPDEEDEAWSKKRKEQEGFNKVFGR